MADAVDHDAHHLLRETSETRIVPRSEIAESYGLVVEVRVRLDDSSHPAQRLFGKSLQDYAEKLATESARQEANGRAPGAHSVEITESAVIRAQEAIEQQSVKRNRPGSNLEAAALLGAPIFSLATGVMGSYLTGTWNWVAFSGLAIIAASCFVYQFKRRLL